MVGASVPSKDKFSLLVHILKHEKPTLSIIFCATRNRVDIIGKNLYKQGINAVAIHGGLSQNRRKKAIDLFHGNKVDVLVASDVAARGLDIKNVYQVINYDSPKNSKEYIHRIGRTARAGSEGRVISLISEPDHENFNAVLEDRSLTVEKLQAPDFKRIPFFVGERRPQGHQGDGHRGHQGHGQRQGGYPRHHGKFGVTRDRR